LADREKSGAMIVTDRKTKWDSAPLVPTTSTVESPGA